ncbi:hypothetical protein [Mycolicibacterium llatzerense]|uniref:hypothetical protein n=1 Tax=Mycolicibacterium llatzerense TaxID=280871 RepID=UPI0008DDA5F0|nr:hypothetical protein [Mycolicibacterium llatzerense]
MRFTQFTPTEKATRWGFISTIAVAWLSFFLVLGLGLLTVLRHDQKPVDVYRDINRVAKAQFFAQNFFLVWAAGTGDASDDKSGGDSQKAKAGSDTQKLATMMAGTGAPTLNSNPFTVLYINTTDVQVTPAGGQTEWEWNVGATIARSGSTVRTYYLVTLIESGGGFKALQLPRPINPKDRNFTVAPHYTVGADTKSPLGTQVAGFMSAYYATDPTSDASKQPRSLGTFVTSNFTDAAIAASPYTSVTVESISLAKSDVEVARAQPGDTVHALVTARAAASDSTFNTINAALKLTLSNNKMWLIDGFDGPIDFGAVSYK